MKIKHSACVACRSLVAVILLSPAIASADWPWPFQKTNKPVAESKPVWASANELGDRSNKPRPKPSILSSVKHNVTSMPKKLYWNTKAALTPSKKPVVKKPIEPGYRDPGYHAEPLKKSDKPTGIKSWFVKQEESHPSRSIGDFISAPKPQ